MLKPLCGDQPCRAPPTRGAVGECTEVFTLHSPWQASIKVGGEGAARLPLDTLTHSIRRCQTSGRLAFW